MSTSRETWAERMRRENAHVTILSIEELRQLPACGDYDAGVYFLWLGDELQYVGKSRHIHNRLIHHDWALQYGHLRSRKTRQIKYDRHTCIVVEQGPIIQDIDALNDKLRPIERAYIAHYQPPFNFLGQNPGT